MQKPGLFEFFINSHFLPKKPHFCSKTTQNRQKTSIFEQLFKTHIIQNYSVYDYLMRLQILETCTLIVILTLKKG